MVTVNRDEASGELIALDAHPLLREYFTVRVRNGSFWSSFFRKQLHRIFPRISVASRAWRAAHQRLYVHLSKTTPSKPRPTLEDLQPLYQAVAHGCQAGLQEEAGIAIYYVRIMRGASKALKGDDSDGLYSTRVLGAFGTDLGLVANFFDRPWNVVSTAITPELQSQVLSVAGYLLRALCRMQEALATTQSAYALAVSSSDAAKASRFSSDLSIIHLSLGQITEAVAVARECVTYADQTTFVSDQGDSHDGRVLWRMLARATGAEALHQAGRHLEAETSFRAAEEIQAECEPEFPLLYAVHGYAYCDFLLAFPERTAWRMTLERSFSPPTGEAIDVISPLWNASTCLHNCDIVTARATRTLQWMIERSWLLESALDYLTLCNASLCAAILSGSSIESCEEATRRAVEGLHRAGQQFMLPRGLLTRAWQRKLAGALAGPESAQADLDEAWEIAERGSMKLFLADIHLHRARLFFREAQYPWESPLADLAAAEILITDCGYHRRDKELADAKEVILAK